MKICIEEGKLEMYRGLARLRKRREMYIKAFVASTGFLPEDIIIIEHRDHKAGLLTQTYAHKNSELGRLANREKELKRICNEQEYDITILKNILEEIYKRYPHIKTETEIES